MKLDSAFALTRQSLVLDRRLMARGDMPIRQRMEFVATKYRLLARHALKPFTLG